MFIFVERPELRVHWGTKVLNPFEPIAISCFFSKGIAEGIYNMFSHYMGESEENIPNLQNMPKICICIVCPCTHDKMVQLFNPMKIDRSVKIKTLGLKSKRR